MQQEMDTKKLFEEQVAYAIAELSKYIGEVSRFGSGLGTALRRGFAESVVTDFARQKKDIRDYFLSEEIIFDDKESFRNKRLLIWRLREKPGDGKQTL